MWQAALIAAAAPLWWCLLIWLFVLGAVIGSFINVVVYRLPRGLSLLYPPSRCPACETPIRPRDNVPIFGWLLLGGRCRQCGAAISPRYPLVELTMGLTFAAVAIAGPLSGGLSLPSTTAGPATVDLRRADFGIYAYRLVLLCGLLSAALTEFDGARFSVRLIWPPLAVGLLAPLIWPGMRPLAEPLASIAGDRRADEWHELLPLADSLAGLVVGAVCGLFVGRLARWRRGPAAQPDYAPHRAVVALAWIGVFLGWPAAAALAFAATIIDQLVTSVPRRAAWLHGTEPVVYLFAAALIWILAFS